jgi:hypothetical protein
MFHWVCLIPCLTLFHAKLFESQAELELLLNLNVWDYVKPEFEKNHERSEHPLQKG